MKWFLNGTHESKQGKALEEFQEGREEGLEGNLWMGALGEASNIEYYDAEKTPLIHSWIEEFRSVEVAKESLPSHDMFIAFFEGCRELACYPHFHQIKENGLI
ncbi:hypothetical protein AMTRI_Chr01g110340 [Amborella trichopoda]